MTDRKTYSAPRVLPREPLTLVSSTGGPGVISAPAHGGDPRSDRRLKRDIRFLTRTDAGLSLYAFRYHWDEETYVGVMAQDLLADPRHADAVIRGADGFYKVDYAALGLAMTTLAEWERSADVRSAA